MSLNPRLVDERDTQWETTTASLRVFIDRDGTQEVFDFDSASLSEVKEWVAANTADPAAAVAIALRRNDERGRPGLLWLENTPADHQ